MSTIDLLPIEFWVAVAVLAGAMLYAVTQIRRGTGLPLLAVTGTVVFWYIGDVFYNDYADNHVMVFTPATLSTAWIQVAFFGGSLLAGTALLHPVINRDCERSPSRIFQLYQHGANQSTIQNTLGLFAKISWGIWIGLIVLAFVNAGEDAFRFAFPFVGNPVNPFVRGRIGSGPLSAVFSLATNFHVLVAAGFGLVAALSRNRWVRTCGFFGCLMTWPWFLLNRTRNTMLAACAPGIIAWVCVRFRGPIYVKVILLLLALFVGDTWLRFVMEARNRQQNVAQYFFNSETSDIIDTETKHAGLNMYEELCWLNRLMEEGTYSPNWGRRYLAEAVNPVPRAIWSGKPMIGIDYAIARGQEWSGAADDQAGVGASISTGMIGQGVDNFGPFIGPIAAGLLMALWVILLARIDLHAGSTWHLPLYAIGLVLTFNCGRDITLLVLYPFFFGYTIVLYLDYQQKQGAGVARAGR